MSSLRGFLPALLLSGILITVSSARAGDFAEGNAANWGAFASDSAPTSVVDDTARVRAGSYSLQFDTASGFDTGVTFPKLADVHWDLSTNTHLVFWSYGENTNDFQDNQPIVVLNSPGGFFRYVPDRLLTLNRQWSLIKVPLAGDAHWTRTVSGFPTLADITQLEIHQDTWANGFTMFYDGVQFITLNTNGPPAGPPAPPGVNPEAIVQRVLLFIYDPIMENKGGLRMHQAYGWTDPLLLTQGVIHDFNRNSHRLYLPQLVETQIADEYPIALDGFRYDDVSYDQAIQTGVWHSSGFDYWRFMLEHGLVSRVESGDIDEIWIYGAPGTGMWESTMAGQGGYWCNSGPVVGATNNHLVVIMGWNFERGVGEAIHSFGHRAESIMWKQYDYQWQPNRTNAWSAFALLDKDAPGLGGVGNVHFPVNGQSDYDYANTNFVWSACDAWLNYPYLTNVPRYINYREWAPTDQDSQRDYLNWWYSHFPHVPGKAPAPDERLNNWWRYLIDLDQFKNGNGNLGDPSGIGFAQITAPTGGATVAGVVPITVEAAADGALGRVDLYVDGVFYASDSLAPFTFAWNTGGLLGTHTLAAKAYELQSRAETVSVPVVVSVRGATIHGIVQSNSVPLAGVTITAQASVKGWLKKSASPSAAVPDNDLAGVTNLISISQTGTVVDLHVGVTLRHAHASDLRLTLVHPNGASVRLRSEGGEPERDLITFYPDLTAPGEPLSVLAGLPMTGGWRLVVSDLVGGVTGELESWSLALNYREPQTSVTMTGPDGAYALTNLRAGDYAVRPTSPSATFLPITTNLLLSANVLDASFSAGPNVPPSIITPPQSRTVIAGTNVTLSVSASGTEPLSYQWFFNGAALAGATTSALSLSNLLVADSGLYSVVVSNPIPASATASVTLTVLPTPFMDDLCEGNAGSWDSFVPAWEGATSSVSDDNTHVKVGTQSIRFDTTSGFDTGVKFPKTPAHWDLRSVGWLAFWAFSDNNTTFGFQGAQPVIVLNCAGGSFTLTPNDQLMANHDWAFFRLPLQGNSTWTLAANGIPDPADANQLEIHQDTWDNSFTIYYDGLKFEAKPELSAPQYLTNGQLHLFVSAPVGVQCTLQTSTNLTQWSDLGTRATSQPQEEWFLGAPDGTRFFRVFAY